MANFAYIDGNNLKRGIESQGWKLDYGRFRTYLRDKYDVAVAYYFIGYVASQKPLYSHLRAAGFTLIFKPTFRGPTGKVKGNCDAELVLQAMIDFERYEKAVLVTGDGDFACLAQYLESKGKLRMVIAPSFHGCSSLLKRNIRNLTIMENVRNRLEYK